MSAAFQSRFPIREDNKMLYFSKNVREKMEENRLNYLRKFRSSLRIFHLSARKIIGRTGIYIFVHAFYSSCH